MKHFVGTNRSTKAKKKIMLFFKIIFFPLWFPLLLLIFLVDILSEISEEIFFRSEDILDTFAGYLANKFFK